jgi:two-component system LytT family response regulator
MQIKALIVEDESLASAKLCGLLEGEEGVQVIGACEDSRQALDKVHQEWPDVVFLDVQLAGDNGFTFLSSIPKESSARPPKVIFTTAHEAYAVQAFEANAVDFLLKPFSRERLHTAVQKLRKELERDQRESLSTAAAAPAMDAPAAKYIRQLAFKSRGRLIFTNVNDIEWVSAEGNYVRIFAREQSHLIRGTVQAMEEKLDPKMFVRIHRSSIINLEYVVEMKPWAGDGERFVVMRGGTRFQIGRNFRSRVTDLLNSVGRGEAVPTRAKVENV